MPEEGVTVGLDHEEGLRLADAAVTVGATGDLVRGYSKPVVLNQQGGKARKRPGGTTVVPTAPWP